VPGEAGAATGFGASRIEDDLGPFATGATSENNDVITFWASRPSILSLLEWRLRGFARRESRSRSSDWEAKTALEASDADFMAGAVAFSGPNRINPIKYLHYSESK